MRSLLVLVAIVLVILVIRESCMMKKEGYADQVMHGVAGGIAGPILDPGLYVYEKGRRPAPTYLESMPPEPPV